MKRCRSISVAALMGVSALSITACEEAKVDATVFSNLQQCLDDGGLPQEQCEAGLREARSQHAEVSPKYSSKEDCEGDFGAGKCETALQDCEWRIRFYALDDGIYDGQHAWRRTGFRIHTTPLPFGRRS